MAITPTAAQLSVLQLNAALFGSAVGTTAMAAALPTFTDGNTYAQSLITSNSAYSILTPEQAYTKAITQMSAGTAITAADISALVTALLEYTGTGKLLPNVGAGLNLVTTFLYNNASTLSNVWTTTAQQVVNRTTVASYYTLDLGTAAASTSVLSSVTSNTSTVDNAIGAITGQTYNLVSAAENVTGTSGNDIFNGSDTTLVLDVLDGAGGIDTLNYNDVAGNTNINGLGLTLSNMEIINLRSTGAAVATTTGFTGVTNLNVLQGTTTTVTAGTSTDVKVSGTSSTVSVTGGKAVTVSSGTDLTLDGGAGDITVSDVTGAIGIDKGKNISVSVATADKDIVIGATTVNAGTISVTDSNVGAADIKVDGGTSVTINATGSTGGGKVITVGNGGAATDLPTGVVSISSAQTAVAATDVALNDITAKGGSTITVTQTADTSKAAADTTGQTLSQGDVTVVGGNGTTSVTVNQAKSTTKVAAVTAVAGVTETASVKFTALTAGQTLILGGLTFTASTAMTAAEAAAAFSNLINGTIPATGDTQSAGPASKGVYTGAFSGWTSGAVNVDTVVFTSTTANTDVANLANTGTGSVTVTTTAGSAATAAKTGVLGVANGVVLIDDAATAAITTVSVDGYAEGSKIGDTATLSKLANLSLANSGSTAAGTATGDMTVDAAGVASLNLTINNIKGAVSLDGAADSALKTLNLTTTGADSSFALTAAAVETLNISGTKAATLSSGTFTALKTVTLSGSAGATFDSDEADTLTSVNTSATTGAFTGFINGTQATFTGGSGVDTLTLVTGTALTKAIDLGAGNDTLSFAALSVTGSTATLSGGDGTDTLSMSAACADGLDATPQTFITNFERLTINDAYGDNDDTLDTLTLNLANLGFANYVTTTGTVADTTNVSNSDVLVLDKLATNGTVVLAGKGLVTVNVADATTGTADVLNVINTVADGGKLTAAKVETINLTQSTANGALIVTAADATAMTIAASKTLGLTLTGSTKLVSIDGSASTAAITVTSLNTTSATTIKGGSANDILTAATGTTADVLIGGGGDDTLTANAGLSTLTGGTGNDLFVISTASVNSSSYATITDFAAGDLVKMTGASSFASAKVTLADTAVFQDYCNAAIATLGDNASGSAGAVGWFQYGGNTYLVMDKNDDQTTFTNNVDFIVKLTGLVDLTNASFNNTHDTIGL